MCKRVLIIDDDPLQGQQMARMLASQFEVETATNAVDAFALLDRIEFAVVLVDLMMPPHNGGLAILKQIRSSHEYITRILFSGAITGEALLETLNTGDAWRCVSKPVSSGEHLRAIVGEGCRRHKTLNLAAAIERVRADGEVRGKHIHERIDRLALEVQLVRKQQQEHGGELATVAKHVDDIENTSPGVDVTKIRESVGDHAEQIGKLAAAAAAKGARLDSVETASKRTADAVKVVMSRLDSLQGHGARGSERPTMTTLESKVKVAGVVGGIAALVGTGGGQVVVEIIKHVWK